MVEPEDALTVAARERMESLAEAGGEAYCDNQMSRAAELFQKAMEIAESIGDRRAGINYRVLYAASIYGTAKLRQALAILTPILQEGTEDGDDADIYNALTTYIHIAINLPVSLGAIEKARKRTEQFLRDSGRLNWRHNLLLLQSQLYQFRGLPAPALATAQEAWNIWADEHPYFTADTHLDQLVHVSLALRDTKRARAYLDEWERDDHNQIPKEREKGSCFRESQLARLEGRFTEAVDWVRRAELVDGKPYPETVRAFLCTGNLERARDELIRLLADRHSEIGHTRYNLRLVRGDYHLAAARRFAGIAPVDDEYGVEFPPPVRNAHPSETGRALARSRNAYRAALKLGRWIDDKLECTGRQEDIATRLERVEAIALHL